ncbi:MAG TPA: hypothetical protein VI320_14100 [Terracidiphilus sp.]|jgi:amidase
MAVTSRSSGVISSRAIPATITGQRELTPSEIAQVLGTAAEYHVSEVADRNAGMVLKISKARLATLL